MIRFIARLVLMSLWSLPMALAQNLPIDPGELSALRDAAPKAQWEDTLSIVADVMCDGKSDTVVVSSNANAVWLGVVPSHFGKKPGKPLVQSWPIGHPHGQDAFCARPIRIEVYPLHCDSELGKLQGCKPIKGCQAFSIDDGECDSFNFYWDSDKHSLAIWRN